MDKLAFTFLGLYKTHCSNLVCNDEYGDSSNNGHNKEKTGGACNVRGRNDVWIQNFNVKALRK
jgi:hypothetical protein